jgi:hypothetical protein
VSDENMAIVTVTFPSGVSSYEFEHDFGAIPEIILVDSLEDIGVTPTAPYALRTETHFTITLSGGSTLMTDTVFNVFLSGTATPTPEPTPFYSDVNTVKILCSIEPDETYADTDITKARTTADAIINNHLSIYTTTPLTTTPASIVAVANFLAAGTYMQKNAEGEKEHVYWQKGMKILSDYIQVQYSAKKPNGAITLAFRRGKAV